MAAISSPTASSGESKLTGFDRLPFKPSVSIAPFKINVSDDKLRQLKTLLDLSDLGPQTHFNTRPFSDNYGVTHEWLSSVKQVWQKEYDWRKREHRFNSFPQFKAPITDQYNETHSIHFMALFSRNPKAIPICFVHGWPSSILEYVGVLDILRNKYTPDTLPYHVIVPSLPGYTFSSQASVERRMVLTDASDIVHRLMMVLGFKSTGYIASGGDVGAYISRILAAKYAECKGLHLTNSNFELPPDADLSDLTEDEKNALEITKQQIASGMGYAIEHGTRPSTIGFVLQGNPMGILAWIGEKYLKWTDIIPPVEDILDVALLYWVTSSMARATWPYVEFFGRGPLSYRIHNDPEYYCHKPFGYSFFPKEMGALPRKFVAQTGDLVYYGTQKKGGHFAALEQPYGYLADVEAFMKIGFGTGSGSA